MFQTKYAKMHINRNKVNFNSGRDHLANSNLQNTSSIVHKREDECERDGPQSTRLSRNQSGQKFVSEYCKQGVAHSNEKVKPK